MLWGIDIGPYGGMVGVVFGSRERLGVMISSEQWRRIERRRRLGGYVWQSRETAERVACGELDEGMALTRSHAAYVRMVLRVLEEDEEVGS